MTSPVVYERAHFQVLFAGVLVGTPVGSFYSWSILNDPLYAARPNWNENAAAHALSALLAAFGLSCSISGKLAGVKIENKYLSLLGSFIAGGAAILCGYAVNLDFVSLFYVGATFVGIGFGMGYVAFIHEIMAWWKHAPGFGSGMCMMLSSAGSFIFVWVLFSFLNAFQDDKDPTIAPSKTLIFYGVCTGASQALGSLLMGPKSNFPKLSTPSAARTTPLPTLTILTSIQFWMLFWMFFANLTPMLGILSILASFLPDKFPPFSSATAATYLAALNIAGTIMRLFVGLAQAKFGTRPLFCGAAFAQCVICAVLPYVLSTGDVTLFIALLFPAKIAYGASFPLINIFAGETFGMENRAQVYGLLIFGLVTAALIGPTLISLNTSTSLFNSFCYGSAVVTGLGLLCAVVLKPLSIPPGFETLLSPTAEKVT